jgi:hypothetical protein
MIKELKKVLLSLGAIAIGFGLAFLAARVSNLFFILLPVMAFALGYVSSWRWGLLCGFLLFGGYSFALALMWEIRYAFVGFPQYILAFISGGFGILLIGALAPFTRRGIGKIASIAAFVALAAVVAWCAYTAVPGYRYVYQVMVLSPEDTEIYVPVETTSHTLVSDLINMSEQVYGSYGPDIYKAELVNTDYGRMWNVGLYGRLSDDNQISRSSNWIRGIGPVQSWQRLSPVNAVQLKPSGNEMAVNRSEQDSPGLLSGSKVVKEFTVPIKAISDTAVSYRLILLVGIDRTESVHFGYTRTESYTEHLEYKGEANSGWVQVPVKGYHSLNIRGTGD